MEQRQIAAFVPPPPSNSATPLAAALAIVSQLMSGAMCMCVSDRLMGPRAGLFIRLNPPSGPPSSTGAVDKGLGPHQCYAPGDAAVTQRMEDMLSPITTIDCLWAGWWVVVLGRLEAGGSLWLLVGASL